MTDGNEASLWSSGEAQLLRMMYGAMESGVQGARCACGLAVVYCVL